MDNSNSKILLNRAIKILDYANMEYSLQMLCKNLFGNRNNSERMN